MLTILGMGTLVGVGYATTPTPQAPKADVENQGSHVYFDDGKKQIVQIGAKRQLLTTSTMGEKVRFAAMAAEDMGFMSESGISPRGMARAVWNTATGTQTQGGSTITQQLARNYYQGLSQQRTLSRKFREIFASIKLSQNLSHDDILTRYLNTIDFGRQSSGIGQAAHSYFGKEAMDLDWGQAAMLGALIQQPGYFHSQPTPGQATDPAYDALVQRWHYVLGNLVKMGKITQADAASMTFPKTQSNWDDTKKNQDLQTTYIKQRVFKEMKDAGISETDVLNKGYKITTSLNQKWMDYAQQAMNEKQVGKWPSNVREGLIAVDPTDGSVRAFYGGNPTKDKNGDVDSVFTNGAQVGSSFKPYVLATALTKGYNVKSMISGASPQNFDSQGNNLPMGQPGYPVHNDSGDPKMGVIDLVKATAMSVNTAYVKLDLVLGGRDVANTAERLGVLKPWLDGFVNQGGMALGIANISAAVQASGYSAFANGGYAVQPHIIKSVVDQAGNPVPLPWQKTLKDAKSHPVLTKDQADQMTYALRQVVEKGTASKAALPDRPVAGKTGTTEGNHAGWFVGYTPPGSVQLSTAVTMYNTNPNGAITGIPGFTGDIYGGTVPAEIWSSFMQKVDQNSAPGQFQDPTFTGQANMWDSPSLTPASPPASPTAPGKNCKPRRGGGQPNCGGTTSSSPPPGGGNNNTPCYNAPGSPPGCNPNLPPPPGSPYHDTWCMSHPKSPSCGKQSSPPPGNGPPPNGIG